MTDRDRDRHPTEKFAPVPDWAIALTEKVTSGFGEIRREIKIVSDNQVDLTTRMSRVESRQDSIEARQNNGSLRARSESALNEKQQEELTKIADKVVNIEIDGSATKAEVRELKAEVASLRSDFARKTDLQTEILRDLQKGARHIFRKPSVQHAVTSFVIACFIAGGVAVGALANGCQLTKAPSKVQTP